MLRLVLWDLTRGMPTAVRVLWQKLGTRSALRTLALFLWRSITWDPFRDFPRQRITLPERFTRHQLRPVLILDDVLRRNLKMSKDDSCRVLGDVVAASGSSYIRSHVAHFAKRNLTSLSAPEKRSLLASVLLRFLNAEAETAEVPTAVLAFDVTRCHFAELTARLGKPELGALFCRADDQFFSEPGLPLRLDRVRTIARGNERCEFRFVSNS